MRPNIKNGTKIFICTSRSVYDGKDWDKILCYSAQEEAFHSYRRNQIPLRRLDYEIKYITGKSIEEVSLKFIEFFRFHILIDPGAFHNLELVERDGVKNILKSINGPIMYRIEAINES